MTTHRTLRDGCLVLVALVWALPGIAFAQRNPSGLPAPRLLQVSPCGAKAGATVEIVVAGHHLEEPEKLFFSHPGLTAEYVPPPVPEIDPKTKQPKPNPGQLPADHYKFKVTVPANVPLGNHDVRLVNKWGVSNPRTFVVGDLVEVSEKEPNNDVDQAQKVDLNTTINGAIGNATDVDYYVFKAAKGQRVVVSCLASSIDSRLQPQIEIYDRKDRQIAWNRAYAGYDAITDFTAPEEGEYHVRLFQFTHTLRGPIPGNMPPGSSEYFYRLSVTTAPWIDAVVPNVVEPGKPTMVTVYGRNLPGGKLDPTAVIDDVVLEKATVVVNAPADGKGKLTSSSVVVPSAAWQDGFDFRLKNATGSSNAFLLGIAHAPVITETGDNDTPERAQQVTLPCEIAGQVEKRRDRDWFSFAAKKGETWNVEVVSNRLGAPTYMMLLVRAAGSKNEMYESPLQENTNLLDRKFFSRSEDPPVYRFTAPADGTYQLLIVSRAGDTLFGPRHTYAVRLTRDEPDFKLVALSGAIDTPDAPNVGGGGHEAFTVIVERSPTFTGDVELSIDGLPTGVTCPPQTLHGSVRKTTLVLSAPTDSSAWTGRIRIQGTATINGNKVVREARNAGIVWPVQPNNNTPTWSRLDREMWLAVRGKALFTLTPTLDKPEVVQGDKATVKLKVDRLLPDLKAPMQVGLMQSQNQPGTELPNNFRLNNNQPINVNPDQKEVSLPLTVANDVAPGVYNVVFRGQTQINYNKDPKAKNKGNVIAVQPSAPLSVTVVPKVVAELRVSASPVNVKVGGESAVVVRVQRRLNYQGEFTVKLVLPKDVVGVEADEVKIPAGQDEVKLLLRAPEDASPGARNNLVVKATALWNGKTPTVHEVRLNVNVVK